MAASATLQPVRCAIYTRKSTDEGLDQAFTSLDAQREAGESYIRSQAAEGWQSLPCRYDDGGFTGANMDRPGMRKLIADIEAGRMDCVVVYKVDRLSRSLLDFANLMNVFQKHGVTFVSVTQQFNTATPVGRLTLHILLSFSEFEREIIRERTRDKKAAARKKGKWIGGYVPLGYDLDTKEGRLVVNEAEAEMLREIFELFAATGSIEQTLAACEERGWKTKTWTTHDDTVHEGRLFTEGSLVRLLGNALYTGAVIYKDRTYPGEHQPIIAKRVWSRVNALLRRLIDERRKEKRLNRSQALLSGLLWCASCEKLMTSTASTVRRRRYEYYACRANGCGSIRAGAIESSVVEQTIAALHAVPAGPGALRTRKLRRAFGRDWRSLDAQQLKAAVQASVERVCYDRRNGRVLLELKEQENRRA